MSPVWPIRRFARQLLRWAGALCLAAALSASGRDQTYVVKHHDTLSGIARRFGVSSGQLADRNGISRRKPLYVGQHLIIPVKAPPAASRAKAPPMLLDAPVRRAIEQAPVSRYRWKYIVIHHSGVDEGTLQSIDHYHRTERHMEHGLAYHFLIGNGHGMGDGEIAVGDRWKAQLNGGHLRSEDQNKIALGICLIGNFDKTPPTAKQLRSLENLIRVLLKRCDLSAGSVRTHQQINIVRTECPGSKFPTQAFLGKLKRPAG